VIDAVKDFSERRREMWPIIDSYEVNEVTKDFADVTEGTDALGKNFWARERYEWPEPGLVRTDTTDSNVFRAGEQLGASGDRPGGKMQGRGRQRPQDEARPSLPSDRIGHAAHQVEVPQ